MKSFKFVAGVAALVLAGSAIVIATARSEHPVIASPQDHPVIATPRDGHPQVDAAAPVSFVENRGQINAGVRYYAQGNGFGFYLTHSAVMLTFAKRSADIASVLQASDELALALRFVGADPAVEPQGADRSPGVVNDLRGDDPARWRTAVPQFRDVVYRDLWPHIDLRLREQAGVLKYEFHLRPGASPDEIGLAYDGAQGLAVGGDGGLAISTPLGTLTDSRPVSYQEIAGVRTPVASRYVVNKGANGGRFSFAVGGYRSDRELVIDPGVQYTTFLGGNAAETGEGIEANAAGNVYVAGTTQSPDFPTTTGAFRRTGAAQNNADVFVTKLNPAGTALVYSTFVGGSDMEFGHGLAVDDAGNAYVTGTTKSSNFPTTGGAFDRSLNIPPNCPRCASDNTDGFAFKLNAAGSALLYSTYLGGTDIDSPRAVAVDGAGNAYVTGETLSADFPTTAGALSRTLRGEYDMFVTKVNPSGSRLSYSTFLGGTLTDDGQRIAVDSAGDAYALGFSRSPDFPTTTAAFDRTANGDFDVTLTKLNPSGSAVLYSTYLGGGGFDSGGGLAVDAAGSAYVAGGTGSADWPTTPGAFDRTFDDGDAYVTKVSPAGSTLVFSTFVGGSAGDNFTGIVLDPAGNSWLTGNTGSIDYPVTAGAPDSTINGGATDATITELNSTGSTVLFGSFLGGSQSDSGLDIARDTSGDVYVTGLTYSQDFPATAGAYDRVFNGDLSIFWGDAFVTKIDIDATTSNPPAPPGVPVAPTLVSPAPAASVPQPVTFDWNDVPEAVSYTIQIDDSSAFTEPLVRNQSVTSSVYATSDLASTTHFWRVRGVNSAGIAGPWSAARSVTPQAAPPPAALSTISLNPTSVEGGTAAAGTVVMSVGAPNGAVITLSSSNPAVAGVPATTTVAPNGFTGDFAVTTSPVGATTSVTVTAGYNGLTRTALLAVTPAGAAVSLQQLIVSPASVTGGSSSSAFVTLSGGAPTGGAPVRLSSSNPSVVGVPATTTIGQGATTAGFTLTTAAVASPTPVTITASYNGTSLTATATVTPAAAPPPPASVTLTVTATGRSGETVLSTPSGINVTTGTTGAATFTSGALITLRVANGRDAVWSGACSSGGKKTKTCTLAVNANATVAANIP